MVSKNKHFLVTFNTLHNGQNSVATAEVWAENAAHAEQLFKRDHDNNGMTYQILSVEEIR